MSNDMQPGPELDRMIAEKVMGWQPYAGVGTFLKPCGVIVYTNKSHHNPWSPSTNIANAWEVVEHLVQKRPGIVFRINRDAWGVVCRIFSEQGDGIASSNQETPAHAICLAALKSVGEFP